MQNVAQVDARKSHLLGILESSAGYLSGYNTQRKLERNLLLVTDLKVSVHKRPAVAKRP